MAIRSLWLRCCAVVLLVGLCGAQLPAASPTLSLILPRGLHRGKEHVLTFSGARLSDAQEIFFYDEGFQVKKIEPEGSNRLKVTVEVAADCRLGEHAAQVRTASGISDLRNFFVGQFPSVAEKEPNNDAAAAQPIDMNVTVEGVVQAEDIDVFAVRVKQGQRLSVEVEGMRSGTAMLDPLVTILNSWPFPMTLRCWPRIPQFRLSPPKTGRTWSCCATAPTKAIAAHFIACMWERFPAQRRSIPLAASWARRLTCVC